MNSFILKEVLEQLLDSNQSLAEPLLKLNYIAKIVNNKELEDFTENEYKGYPNKESLPSYRKVPARIMVVYSIQGYQNTMEIPSRYLDNPKYKDALSTYRIYEGVKRIEEGVERVAKNPELKITSPGLKKGLSPIKSWISQYYDGDFEVDECFQEIYLHSFRDILSSLRLELMRFVTNLGREHGFDVNVLTFKKDIISINQTINYHMGHTINNTGSGSVNNVGDGSFHNANITINQGDLQQLKQALLTEGVESADVQELEEILKEENPDANGKLGAKTNQWLGKIYAKGLEVGGKLLTAVSGNVIGGIIRAYYGIGN